jgi:hypothetical protein
MQQSPITNTGPAVRLVSVIGFMSSGNAALCRDEFGKEYEVPMGIERTNRRPVVGEQWLIDSSFGNWSFAGWLASTKQPATNMAGVIQLFAESALPETHLACDGSEVAKSDYPALYEAIGNSFGEPEPQEEAIAIEASQDFVLEGTALTGGDLLATEDGYLGLQFTTDETMSFSTGDTDVMVIATKAAGARLRSVGETPPLWHIHDPRECLRLMDTTDLTAFLFIARRTAPHSPTSASFILDFPAGSSQLDQVVIGQRHKVAGVGEDALIRQTQETARQWYASERRSSRAKTHQMWVDTATGGLANTWSLLMFIHDNYTATSPALSVSPSVSFVLGNSSLTVAGDFGVTTGLRIDTYQTSKEDDTAPPRRRFSANADWENAAVGHNWVSIGVVAAEGEGVRERLVLPDITPPAEGTVYGISTGL